MYNFGGNIYFIFLYMYVFVSLCICAPSPGAGPTGGSKQLYVGAENWAQVLYNSSKVS